jgi:hypothetical protein
MFNGTVDFVAKIKGNGLTFPLFDFNPNEPGVVRVELEGPNGDEIRSTVHLAAVASENDGRVLARKVVTAALSRITYLRQVAIEDARRTGDHFVPAIQQHGVHAVAINMNLILSDAAHVVVGVAPAVLKAALEQPSPPGEPNFGLFRSALQSTGPVEEFMHLYNIMLTRRDAHEGVSAYERRMTTRAASSADGTSSSHSAVSTIDSMAIPEWL